MIFYQLSYKKHWITYLLVLVLCFYFFFETINLTHEKNKIDNQLLGQVLEVEGFVDSIVTSRGDNATWYFNYTIQSVNGKETNNSKDIKVRLSWYDSWSRPIIKPKINEKWKLFVKLKEINSSINPGGFDYEKWAFTNHIMATGYIHSNYWSDQSITDNHSSWLVNLVNIPSQWRSHLLLLLNKSQVSDNAKALFKALSIGDRSELTNKQWLTFQKTGTAHLLSISGLHIGFSALTFGFLFSILWRRSAYACHILPAPYVFALAGIFFAFIYAIISGFQIPAQRAYTMIFVGFSSVFYKRYLPNYIVLLAALMTVLLLDIRAFFATGFWLSFLSVSIIMIVISKQNSQTNQIALQHVFNSKPEQLIDDKKMSIWQRVKQIIYLQCVISICLMPSLLYFFQLASWVSPFANFILTPLVSLIIVPLVLLLIVISIFPDVFLILLIPVGFMLDWLNYILEFIYDNIDGGFIWKSPNLIETIFATITLLGIFIFKFKSYLFYSSLTVLIIVLFTFSTNTTIKQGEAKVDVLDVGQALSIVIRTKNKTLVYDTGNRGDGKRVIVPFLRQVSRKPDIVLLSHDDIDHTGGSKFIFRQYPDSKVISWKDCDTKWSWNEVMFQIIKIDDITNKVIKDNNKSCVLKITTKNKQSFLITADIEKQTEQYLVTKFPKFIISDIMMVPHQGSLTSSTPKFIDKVNPKVAIISSGYKNHFNHPHPKIIKRYLKRNIKILSTICSGTISFTLGSKQNKLDISEHRVNKGSFWLRQC